MDIAIRCRDLCKGYDGRRRLRERIGGSLRGTRLSERLTVEETIDQILSNPRSFTPTGVFFRHATVRVARRRSSLSGKTANDRLDSASVRA